MDKYREFSDALLAHVATITVDLTGTYPSKGIDGKTISAEEITEALKFWKGIRTFGTTIDKGAFKAEEYHQTREQLLNNYRSDDRPLIALVATVESLPTKVWRRALWHYNIDFQSFESFLRRITMEQVRGLQESLDAIRQGRAPLCFREGWKNVLRRTFRPSWTSVDRLTEETEEDRDRRYEAKGSIAYEFFGIDFGHVLYREEADERRIEGNLATRFLSKKRHDNDFVVNQEDGVYWWSYRMARSNYIWHPNRTVRLKKAICPGFWYTLGVWFFVLLVSPAAAVAAGIAVALDASLWVSAPIMFVGAATPIILLAMLGKYLLIRAVRFIEWAAERLDVLIDEEYWASVGIGLAITVVGSLFGIFTAGVGHVMYLWFYESIPLAIYMTAFLFLYVVHLITNANEDSPRTWGLPILGLPTALFVLGKVIFDHYEFLWSVVAAVAMFLVENLGEILSWGILAAIVVLPFAAAFQFEKLDRKAWSGDEEAAAKLKTLAFIGKITAWVFGIATVAVNIYAFAFVIAAITPAMVAGSILILFLVGGVVYFVTRRYATEYVASTQQFSEEELKQLRWRDGMDAKILRDTARNKWLRSQDDYSAKVWWLLGFIKWHFDVEDFPIELLSIDAEGFRVAEEYDMHFRNEYPWMEIAKRREYVKCMLKGIPVAEAEQTIDHWRARRRAWAEMWWRIYDMSIGRFIERPIRFVGRIVTKLVRDAHTMWQTLNESCPYWMEPRRLDRD